MREFLREYKVDALLFAVVCACVCYFGYLGDRENRADTLKNAASPLKREGIKIEAPPHQTYRPFLNDVPQDFHPPQD